MAFGYKTGGRVKGAHGARALLDKCHNMNVDVFEEMLKLACAEANNDKRFSKLRDLAQFLYAKPRDELDITKFTKEQVREYIMGIANDDTARGA